MNCKSYFSKLLYSLPQNPNRQYYVGADNIKQELYLKPSDGNGIVFNELWNSFSSLTTIPFNRVFTTKDIMYFTIPYSTSLSPFKVMVDTYTLLHHTVIWMLLMNMQMT